VPITIRPARLADCNAIGAIHVAAWRETYAGRMKQQLLDELSATARAARWRQALERDPPIPALFVATAEFDEVVGFAAGGPWRGASQKADGEIYAIYMLRAAQRRGAGRMLMAAVAAALETHALRSLGLWVLRANSSARSFYDALGGSVIGERIELMDGHDLTELAYGWSDMTALLTLRPDRDG
jgi:ribosomal protein S18 acetylase RimI-like enzyme